MTSSPLPSTARRTGPLKWTGLIALGFVTDFLDTLGVGSFATTSTALKLGKVCEDEYIPGTLNIGHALPTILERIRRSFHAANCSVKFRLFGKTLPNRARISKPPSLRTKWKMFSATTLTTIPTPNRGRRATRRLLQCHRAPHH